MRNFYRGKCLYGNRKYRGAFERCRQTIKPITATIPKALHTIPAKAPEQAYTPKVQALIAKGYDVLTRTDELAELKAMDEGAFNEVYKRKFGWYPGQRQKSK